MQPVTVCRSANWSLVLTLVGRSAEGVIALLTPRRPVRLLRRLEAREVVALVGNGSYVLTADGELPKRVVSGAEVCRVGDLLVDGDLVGRSAERAVGIRGDRNVGGDSVKLSPGVFVFAPRTFADGSGSAASKVIARREPGR